MTDPDVRLLAPEDRAGARSVAVLHRRAFPDYDSSRLGTGFCQRLLLAYAAHPEAWVAVIDRDGAPAGYLVGAPPTVQRAINRALARSALVAGLRRPDRVLARVLARVRPDPPAPASGAEVAADPPPAPATVRVVLVGTDPQQRGTGLGRHLLEDFAERARARGHEVADLSVELDNPAAIAAYERLGWTWVGDEAGVAARYRLELGSGSVSQG